MNIGKKIILGSLLLTTFFSCSDDDRLEDVRAGKPTATLSSTSETVEEGVETTFTINLDRAISGVSQFMVSLGNVGDKSLHYDYKASGSFSANSEHFGGPGYIVTVPAYQTSATFTITILNNYELDADGRNFEFGFVGVDKMLAKVDDSSTSISIKAVESTNNALSFQLDWTNPVIDLRGDSSNGTYLGTDGNQHEFADFDFDLYVKDASGSPADGQMAATGNVPEISTLDLSTLADGSYSVATDLYAEGSTPAQTFTFPLTLRATKFGAWSYEIPVTEYLSTTPGATDGSNTVVVANFTKSGNVVTLYSADGTELASGRTVQ